MTTAEFNALDSRKQRILVAKDVIAQLKAKKFKATKGTYVAIKDQALSDAVEESSTEQLHERFKTIKQCAVCARGAMFMSTVRLGNQFQLNQMDTEWNGPIATVEAGEVDERLKSVFASDQQYLIEAAFEGRDINSQLYEVMTYDDNGSSLKANIFEDMYNLILAKAKIFYKRYKKSDNRMIAIMKNVIKNKGKFVL